MKLKLLIFPKNKFKVNKEKSTSANSKNKIDELQTKKSQPKVDNSEKKNLRQMQKLMKKKTTKTKKEN